MRSLCLAILGCCIIFSGGLRADEAEEKAKKHLKKMGWPPTALQDIDGKKQITGIALEFHDLKERDIEALQGFKYLEMISVWNGQIEIGVIEQLKKYPKFRQLSFHPDTLTDELLLEFAKHKCLHFLGYPFSRKEEDKFVKWILSVDSKQPETEDDMRYFSFGCRSKITDDGIKGILGLKNLKSLDISRTRISEKGLDSIVKIKTIESVKFDFRSFKNDAVEKFGQLPNLTEVDLEDSEANDGTIKELTHLKKLKRLNLKGTKITDKCLDDLLKFTELEYLNIKDTGISDKSVERLQYLKKLLTIERTKNP